MTETTQYPYSLKFSLGTLILMIILMLLLLRNVIASNSTIIWAVYGVFIFIFLFTASYIVVKRLIPAIKGDIALTLDEQGINDYIRDVSIEWKDIEEIKLIRGRSASIMRIDLKWESDYGKQIIIPLRWIKGRDAEIYDTVMAYFERRSGIIK